MKVGYDKMMVNKVLWIKLSFWEVVYFNIYGFISLNI